MKMFLKTLLSLQGIVLALFFFVASVAVAQVVEAPPSAEEINAFLSALLTLKGAAPIVVASVVIQGVMLLLKTQLGDLVGKWKLALVSLLSFLSTAIGMKLQDPAAAWGVILLSGTVLAALQVFLHQLYLQVMVKKD